MGNLIDHPNVKKKENSTPLDPQEQAVRDFVEKLLSDDKINSRLLSDNWEKEVYVNLFCFGISFFKKILETLKIEVLNHVITVRIEPKPQE